MNLPSVGTCPISTSAIAEDAWPVDINLLFGDTRGAIILWFMGPTGSVGVWFVARTDAVAAEAIAADATAADV